MSGHPPHGSVHHRLTIGGKICHGVDQYLRHFPATPDFEFVIIQSVSDDAEKLKSDKDLPELFLIIFQRKLNKLCDCFYFRC